MWKYDGNNWIWISGSNIIDQQGNYGSLGISSSSNIPGARYYSTSWKDTENARAPGILEEEEVPCCP